MSVEMLQALNNEWHREMRRLPPNHSNLGSEIKKLSKQVCSPESIAIVASFSKKFQEFTELKQAETQEAFNRLKNRYVELAGGELTELGEVRSSMSIIEQFIATKTCLDVEFCSDVIAFRLHHGASLDPIILNPDPMISNFMEYFAELGKSKEELQVLLFYLTLEKNVFQGKGEIENFFDSAKFDLSVNNPDGYKQEQVRACILLYHIKQESDDVTNLNKGFAEALHMPLKDFNKMEVWFLSRLGYLTIDSGLSSVDQQLDQLEVQDQLSQLEELCTDLQQRFFPGKYPQIDMFISEFPKVDFDNVQERASQFKHRVRQLTLILMKYPVLKEDEVLCILIQRFIDRVNMLYSNYPEIVTKIQPQVEEPWTCALQ
ncbi:MAG: hypothetical protein KAR79_00195 [Simkaniaceae bacterium]|nr:hypothetical protein [Simkaniaceae bacterium]